MVSRTPHCSARFVRGAADEGAIVALETTADRRDAVRRGPWSLAAHGGRGAGARPSSRAARFRRLLLAAARNGAEIVAARVTDVAAGVLSVDANPRSLRVGHVIGADGANSLVRRRLASPFARADLSIATGYFAHGVTSDEIVVELTADPPGYIWSFPRPTHLAIGICAQADAGATATALRARTAAWIRSTHIASGAHLESYSWPIPSLTARGFETLTVAGPGWFLVGDAAGLVDPITREGIYFALLSGQWAADALLSGTADLSLMGMPSACATRSPPSWRAGGAVQGRLFRPQFTRLMTDALRHSAGVRAVMADLLTGCQSYTGLKWRLAKTLEVGLAWRLLRT
jgi:flavin-dependent dehydrogenase